MPDFYFRVTIDADSGCDDVVDNNEDEILDDLVQQVEGLYLSDVTDVVPCEGDCECENDVEEGVSITSVEHIAEYELRRRFATPVPTIPGPQGQRVVHHTYT